MASDLIPNVTAVMSTTSHSQAADSLKQSGPTKKWPDLSMYGLHFGTVVMPDGEKRMVMVDENGSYAPLAKQMGFMQSRWFGLYVKSDLKINIPGFQAQFPSARVVHLTNEEIRARIVPLILQRRNRRISDIGNANRRLSWHPHKTSPVSLAVSRAVAAAEEAPQDLSPVVALRQTVLLGMNYLGQEVFESGDGMRFVRSGETVLAKENEEHTANPVFLRAATDEDLVQVAAGMVAEIDAGKVLHSDDFVRFLEAVYGPGVAEETDRVEKFHAALDAAARSRLLKVSGSGRDAFDLALRLHEGRPTFWRAAGRLPTPLPIAVVMQSLAQARVQLSDGFAAPTIIDITKHTGAHSWSMDAISVQENGIPAHDVALAGTFGEVTPGRSVGGVRVTRTDSEALFTSLANRSSDGLTVFLMTTSAPGKLDNEFRRVISAIGQRYEVSGLTDIASTMLGAGSDMASRIVVVGRKRQDQDFTYAIGASIPVIYDYETLWNWGETLRAAEFGEAQIFGEDGREENRWQAPYIPSSQISEPVAMSPRNLLGPVRKALADIVDRYGMGIDELLCEKLGWTMEELEQRLDSEQADAVAIGIQAIDDGSGFVEADATGLGKGRVAATLAVYGKRVGIPVMFLSEKADLFSDFYRDVEDIGCLDQLARPFIVNSDLVVRNGQGKVIARSPNREEAAQILACGDQPEDYDIVLATYSQFNREYNGEHTLRNTRIARAVRGLQKGSVGAYDVILASAPFLGMDDYGALGFADAAGAISYEENNAKALRDRGEHTAADAAADRTAVLRMSSLELMHHLSGIIKTSMTTLKHQWLYSGAMNGALVIPDESHVAAGADSHTGVNIRHLTDNAGAVAYSSATFAKGTGNYLLYARVFPKTLRAANIGVTLERGGEPMQEILSAMLAEDGALVRREHDLSSIEFRVSSDNDRTERNEAWSDGFATVIAAMNYVSGEVRGIAEERNAAALKVVRDAEMVIHQAKRSSTPLTAKQVRLAASKREMVGVHYTNFSSKFYNLARAFMMAVNADQAADLAIKALREGRKPVITVENTMETVLKELLYGVELEDGLSFDGKEPDETKANTAEDTSRDLAALIGEAVEAVEADAASKKKPDFTALGRRVSFKDILKAYVEVMFSATEQVRKDNKVLSTKRISLATPELETAAQELFLIIDQMPEIPLSPIDLVRERVIAAGYTIDEISGRRLKLETDEDGTHRVVRMGERKKQPLKNAFNSGALDALVLSKSGSTGISLHSSRTFADQSQRELIELQPASDIAQRLQFWGRVNRKGQVCSPMVTMVSSNLPAEKRLITMQNAKLRRLSANISGNADNSAINSSAPDILNSIGNEVCFRWMEANPRLAAVLGFKADETAEDQVSRAGTKFVDMLTGRIMMLDVATQRKVYQEITAEFEAVIEQCEADGRNPLKAAEYDLRARRTASKIVQVASGFDSVFDTAVVASELTYTVSVGAINKDEAEAAAAAGHAALIEKLGAKYWKSLSEEVEKKGHALLPALLSKRYSTIEQAISAQEQNAVKSADFKHSFQSKWLRYIRPGALICLGDERHAAMANHVDVKASDDDAGAGVETFYVTDWKVPEDNVLSLAKFKLVGFSSSTRKKREISLATILARDGKWIHSSPERETTKEYKKDLKRFFEKTSEPYEGVETRIILEGNLYRAAEIAEAQRQGASITFTDEKGIWRHAVLMPRSQTMMSVTNLPVVVDNVALLMAAFESREDGMGSIQASDDFRNGKFMKHGVEVRNLATYRLYGSKAGIQVHALGTTDTSAWLTKNKDLLACVVDGKFSGHRNMMVAGVIPGMEERFLEAFMAAADKASTKVLLEGHMRDWYNDHLRELTGQADQAKDALLAAMESDTADELSALISGPSF